MSMITYVYGNTTCATAYTLTGNTNSSFSLTYSTELWINTSTLAKGTFKVPYFTNTNLIYEGYELYSGACGSLILANSFNCLALPATFRTKEYYGFINITGTKFIKLKFSNGNIGQTIPIEFRFTNSNTSSVTSVPCQNLIVNGDFENTIVNCQLSITNEVNNWTQYGNTTPDLYGRNCSSSIAYSNYLNIPSPSSIPISDSWSGASTNNNHFLGLVGQVNYDPMEWDEAMQTTLTSPLQVGKTYLLTFYAKVANNPFGFSGAPPNYLVANDGNILVCGSTGIAPPPSNTTEFLPTNSNAINFVQLGNTITVPNQPNNNLNGWYRFTSQFMVNSANIDNLIIGYSGILPDALVTINYLFLDDVSLYEIPNPINLTFSPPASLTSTSPIITNLATYCTLNGSALPIGGPYTFSSITSNAVSLNTTTGFYEFNPALSACNDLVSINYQVCPNNPPYIITKPISVLSGCCSQSNYTVNANTSINLSSLYGSSPASISNKVFDIGDNATLYFLNSVTFTGCTFRMGKEARLYLNQAAGSTTTFDNCKMFTCGQYMWKGIENENNGQTLIMQNNCIVEDARTAINLFGSSNTVTLTGNTFNKNYISVNVPGQTAAPAIIPYTFKGNTFSCVASTNSPTTTLKLVKPIGSTTYITPPRSYAGIYAIANNTVPVLKIGSTTTATAADINNFTNHDYGIYLVNTKAEIYNNTFNITLRTQLLPKGKFGTAIYGTTNNGFQIPVYGYTTTIGGTGTNQKNTFTSCFTGVEMNTGYDDLTIRGNVFNGIASLLGTYGINLSNDKIIKLNCTSNNFSFIQNAFTHNFTSFPQFALSNNPSTQFCSFSGNTVQNNGLDNSGVYIANLGAANTTTNGRYAIENNTLYGSKIISVTDLANAIQIKTCTLTVKNNTTTGTINNGIEMINSNNTIMEKNVIASDAPTIAACTNQNIFGIKVTNSQQVQVKCNTLSKCGSLVAFEGNCQSPGNGLYGNNLQSGKYGLRFINNAIIGQQSWSTTTPKSSNNTFGAAANFPTILNGRQTFVENNAANPNITSKLYLNSIPTLNASNTPGLNYTSGTGLITALLVSDECVVPPPVPAAAPVAAMSTAIQPATTNTGITDNNVKTLNKVAAYNLIEDMPSLKTVSSLNTFYNNNTTSCIGKLRQVQDQIRLGNFASAKTINNSFTPSCNAETHTKNYFDLYMKWKTDTLCCDSIFKNNILVIANACPETHGIVVNKAQALYNLITKQNNVFTSNCGTSAGSRILNTTPNTNNDEENKAVVISTINENVSIAPNPNNGQFTIQFANTNSEKVNVIIRDASQKTVFDNKLDVKEGQIKLDLAYLKSGVYFAYINDNTGTQKVLKFIIANNE
jgi:Secretion system C-terminal sorting domain